MSFFDLTKYERRGGIFLFIVLFLIVGYRFFEGKEENKWVVVENAKIEKEHEEVARFETSIDKFQEKTPRKKAKKKLTVKGKFDPNTVSKEFLQETGMEEFICDRILKYRLKGGRFRSNSDLRKIYGIDENYWDQLKDSIEIKVELIDINSANVEQFQELNGIGEVLAKRIIKFREALGGFSSIQQLEEVYGIESKVIKGNRERFECSSKVIRSLEINNLSTRELSKHPYIRYNEARDLVIRRSSNPLKSEKDLKEVINDSLRLRKLLPYIKYE